MGRNGRATSGEDLRGRAGRVGPGSAALLLLLLPPIPAAAQVGASGNEALDLRLAGALAEGAAEGELLRAYEQLLFTWIREPDSLAADFDVLATVERIHARRTEAGLAEQPFAASDWNLHSYELGHAGRLRDARRFLETVLPTYSEATPHHALLWLDLAAFHRQLDDPDGSSASLARAGEVLERIDPATLGAAGRETLERARFLHDANRALELVVARGLTDLAAPYVERSWRTARAFLLERGDDSFYLDALLVRVAHGLALDRHEEILRWLEDDEVRGVLEGAARPQLARKILLRAGIARVFLEHRDPDRPREAWDAFRSVEAGMTADDPVSERVLLETWMAICSMNEGRLGDARSLLDRAARRAGAHGGPPGPEQVLLAGLRARLALLETSDPAQLAAELPAVRRAFDASIERWGSREILETGQGFLLYDELRESVSEYVALLLAVHGPKRGASMALEELIRLQGIGSLARSLDAGPATLEAVQRELAGEEHGFLLVLPGWNRSFAFTLDRGGGAWTELAPAHVLHQRRRALLQAVEGLQLGDDPRSGSEQVEELRRAAGEAFLPPAVREKIAGWRGLTVVAVDGMGFLPFEILPWDGATAVGERFALSYLPSFPVGLALVRRSGATPGTAPPTAAEASATVFVALRERAGDGELSFAAAERELLLGSWPFAPPELVVGPEATLEALSAGGLRSRTLLQLVAHGHRAASSPRPHGLQLADSVLTPSGAELLPVPELVAVLACQSWRGPVRSGDDGRDHLAGALFLAGANTLIVSHTRVDYRGGLELMSRTYPGLAAGLAPAEALRRARVAVASAAETPAARWNAGLVHAVGLAQLPVVRAEGPAADRGAGIPGGVFLALAAALAALVVLAVWRLRRRRHGLPGLP